MSALSAIGGPDAEAAILRVVGQDPSPDVRRLAVRALADVGSEAARRLLDELAATDPADYVRSTALRAPRTS